MRRLFILFALPFSLGVKDEPTDCCETKENGGNMYSLKPGPVGDDLTQFNCKDRCIYENIDNPGSTYCFQDGGEYESVCDVPLPQDPGTESTQPIEGTTPDYTPYCTTGTGIIPHSDCTSWDPPFSYLCPPHSICCAQPSDPGATPCCYNGTECVIKPDYLPTCPKEEWSQLSACMPDSGVDGPCPTGSICCQDLSSIPSGSPCCYNGTKCPGPVTLPSCPIEEVPNLSACVPGSEGDFPCPSGSICCQDWSDPSDGRCCYNGTKCPGPDYSTPFCNEGPQLVAGPKCNNTCPPGSICCWEAADPASVQCCYNDTECPGESTPGEVPANPTTPAIESIGTEVNECKKEEGVNYKGNNIDSKVVDEIENCMKWCKDTTECQFWSFRTTDKKCWIKTKLNVTVKNDVFISGNKLCDNSNGTTDPKPPTDNSYPYCNGGATSLTCNISCPPGYVCCIEPAEPVGYQCCYYGSECPGDNDNGTPDPQPPTDYTSYCSVGVPIYGPNNISCPPGSIGCWEPADPGDIPCCYNGTKCAEAAYLPYCPKEGGLHGPTCPPFPPCDACIGGSTPCPSGSVCCYDQSGSPCCYNGTDCPGPDYPPWCGKGLVSNQKCTSSCPPDSICCMEQWDQDARPCCYNGTQCPGNNEQIENK